MIINILGGIASVISFTLFLPQAIATWRNRRTPGSLLVVSVGTQALILVNATIWGAYAITTQAFWVGAPGLVNAPLAIATIWMVRRAKASSRVGLGIAAFVVQDAALSLVPEEALGCEHCGWDGAGAHEILVKTPPGFGSVVACTAATARFGDPQAISTRDAAQAAAA